MEMTCSSETSVDFQWITRCDIPEDRTLRRADFPHFSPVEKANHTPRADATCNHVGWYRTIYNQSRDSTNDS
jgi:hypothetical protein